MLINQEGGKKAQKAQNTSSQPTPAFSPALPAAIKLKFAFAQ
jgi:hypothetical protein